MTAIGKRIKELRVIKNITQAGPTDLVWNVTGRMRLESVEPGFLSLYIDDALVDLSEEADETRMLIDAAMIRSAIKDLEAEKGKSRK